MAEKHSVTFDRVLAQVVDEEVTWLTDDQRDKLLRSLLLQAYQQADADDFLSYALTYHAPVLKGVGVRGLASL